MAIAGTAPRRMGWSLTLAAGALWAASLPAGAHNFAASAFDAVTDGGNVYVQFRIDATSVVEMLNRTSVAGPHLERRDIEVRQQPVFEYLSAHFSLANDGVGCPPTLESAPHLDPATDKVVLAISYRCARELDVLTVASALFEEEKSSHQVLGTFHHKRALENYLFSPGVRQAVIHVRRLAQLGPAEALRPGEFRVVPPPPGAFAGAAPSARAAPTPPMGSGFRKFFVQGVLHILGGIDHVLFVIALVSVIASWGELAKVVTSFTVAHSITLALGALSIVKIMPRLVEPLIAISIIYVALENLLRNHPRARPGVTFAFGLVHGFGFSAVLHDLGLSRAELVPVLLGFNLGVEAGQLVIVAPLAPLVWWLRRRAAGFARFRIAVNACVALVAIWWFIERVFL